MYVNLFALKISKLLLYNFTHMYIFGLEDGKMIVITGAADLVGNVLTRQLVEKRA